MLETESRVKIQLLPKVKAPEAVSNLLVSPPTKQNRHHLRIEGYQLKPRLENKKGGVSFASSLNNQIAKIIKISFA